MARKIDEEQRAVIVRFSLRPGQGDPSGFDLGDMSWRGELGEVSSAGRSPDQGMMIHLSVVLLLDTLRVLLQGRSTTASFVGVDSSFSLTFRATGAGISVASTSGKLAVVSRAALAATVLRAAEELAGSTLGALPAHDGVRDDCAAALNEFRSAARPL
ncbi:hypothetical protein ACFV30_10705 [Streptomyces sp. NPDC059752]|uniref:hypothetical protein n=1 Tax=unclassified Streptomyces TaxID=2593676 RepID=UPI00366705BC